MLIRLLMLLLLAPAFCMAFDPKQDGFTFANETVLAYGVDESGRLQMDSRKEQVPFSRQCFNMVRSAMQFAQFARFDSGQPRLSQEEYRVKLRRLFRISPWNERQRERIVFPGFRNLAEFSRAQTRLIQDELGSWITPYFRVGNWRLAWPPTRWVQTHNAKRLLARIKAGGVRALYLAKFPSMNHAVLAYAASEQTNGDIEFLVYDPNYPQQPTRLRYVKAIRGFELEKRFYFPGGEVRAMPIFVSIFN